MTSTDIKNLLESISNALDAGQKIFPLDLDQNIVNLLKGFDATSYKVVSAVLGTTEENLQQQMPNVIKFLETCHDLFGTDEATRISTFCRNLSQRPIILAIISKMV